MLYVQSPSLTSSVDQAYLKFTGIPFSTVSSSNHASPTGVLPFLIPSLATAPAHEKGLALPAAKLQRWALTEMSHGNKKSGPASRDPFNAEKDVVHEKDDSGVKFGEKGQQHAEDSEESSRRNGHTDMRYDAYLSLLDNRIRNAWVFGSFSSKIQTSFGKLTESTSSTSST